MSIENYGRYQLLKRIATGGMAQIYLARQSGLEGFEKLLVVKRILPHLAENQDFVRMFLDEARIAARLNHPNVVQIFDLGSQDGSYFIAMEYIHGEDVRRVWKRGANRGRTLPLPLVCRVMMDACAGLDYAHKKADAAGKPLGIVHRDISPQNILVTFEGEVKVVDFGIAKAADQATVTRSGVLKGKYSYMSPEQARGERLDRRSDIFALGIVLHELLTGHRLFKRTNDIQTLNAVTECKVPAPSALNPEVPADLDRLVLKALARTPEQRFEDAAELQLALEEWLISHQLASSSALLATYMQELYADRIEQEKRAGEVLLELADEAPHSASLAPPGPAPDEGGISLSGSERATQLGMPSVSDLENTHAARPGASRATPAREDLRRSGDRSVVPPDELRRSGDRSVVPPGELRRSGERSVVPPGELRRSGERPAEAQELRKSAELRSSSLKLSGDLKTPELRQSGADRAAPRFETNRFELPESGEESQTTQAGGSPWDGIEVSASVRFGQPRPKRRLLPMLAAAILLATLSAVGVGAWVRGSRPQAPVLASLQLRSEPAGARISLDGQHRPGVVTPCSLPEVEPGTHALQLELDGHLTHRLELVVRQGGVLEVPLIRLAPEPPPVVPVESPVAVAGPAEAGPAGPVPFTIRSRPLGAMVLIDGKSAGRTPYTVEAAVGAALDFRIELAGFAPVSRTVRVEGPGPQEATVNLERRSAKGKVRFVVTPWATVSCNSLELGETPLADQELAVGTYQCRFVHPELGTVHRRVEVRANDLSKVLVQF
ncbi:MAG: protein kinase [Myxococcota bacterium]|nr:protein kinase [Myxococcota bacterium]